MLARTALRSSQLLARTVATEARLASHGYELPSVNPPKGSYVLATRVGNLMYTAGHLPVQTDGSLITGVIGDTLTAEEGQEAAKAVALSLCATLKHELGDLDRVKRIVKLTGFCNCVDGFQHQPLVINGASDLLVEIFGKERGQHSRSAVGTNALPLGVAVEIEAIVEIDMVPNAQ